MDGVFKSPASLAVDDFNLGKTGHEGIIQIAVKETEGVIDREAPQVDFRRDALTVSFRSIAVHFKGV